MADTIEKKYAHLEDPGIRAFLIAGERFYPPDAVNFTMAEQRAFYDSTAPISASPGRTRCRRRISLTAAFRAGITARPARPAHR